MSSKIRHRRRVSHRTEELTEDRFEEGSKGVLDAEQGLEEIMYVGCGCGLESGCVGASWVEMTLVVRQAEQFPLLFDDILLHLYLIGISPGLA